MTDIENFYGGSILAMVGKNCISIVNDYRLGSGFITTSKQFRRIHQITERIYVGLPTFIPDCQFILNKLKKYVSLYELDEGRKIEPEELSNLLSFMLYSNRASPLYTSPIVIGLKNDNTPYICNMDCLGCKTEPGSFVAGGTAHDSLMGVCEMLFKEDMNEEELFTVSVQAFLNSVDRNALSGWGAECVIITPNKRIVRSIKGRCD